MEGSFEFVCLPSHAQRWLLSPPIFSARLLRFCELPPVCRVSASLPVKSNLLRVSVTWGSENAISGCLHVWKLKFRQRCLIPRYNHSDENRKSLPLLRICHLRHLGTFLLYFHPNLVWLTNELLSDCLCWSQCCYYSPLMPLVTFWLIILGWC